VRVNTAFSVSFANFLISDESPKKYSRLTSQKIAFEKGMVAGKIGCKIATKGMEYKP
jgi:hypothetical protein